MSAATTYSELTGSAQQRLALALSRPELSDAGLPDLLALASTAHGDLSAALAHLGRTLMRPVATAAAAQRRAARRRGPQGRVLTDLDRRGRRRDWSVADPDPGTAARDIWEAARAIRAAADLWSTHHSGSGAPRTPESSRMRHPAVLGAATREWELLVSTARQVAEALLRAMTTAQPGESEDITCRAGLAHLVAYPGSITRRSAGPNSVDITVARPARSGDGDALALLAESVTRLRQAAWSLAESGQAPIPALSNMAAVGAALSLAAVEAAGRIRASDRSRADDGAAATDRAGADALRRMHAGWTAAGQALENLRSPHPGTTILQVERLDVLALLRRVPTEDPRGGVANPACAKDDGSAAGLVALAGRYAEVAAFNTRGLRAAAQRGDIYIRGEALPQPALARRPDLLKAKLERSLVPAPTMVVAALEHRYREVLRALDDDAFDGTPAA